MSGPRPEARSQHEHPPFLVGREREQALLRDCLAAALAGHGGLALIGGEAGIGKTALAEWALAEAQGRGAAVLVGRCYDLTETPPYGPWLEAFARYPANSNLP
ncbi:MAG TPA: ATP-binding protein, partial [Thermomicrobiales bacterium]|nr:ATP-binding protein [Thermomicrobiales bacterium]